MQCHADGWRAVETSWSKAQRHAECLSGCIRSCSFLIGMFHMESDTVFDGRGQTATLNDLDCLVFWLLADRVGSLGDKRDSCIILGDQTSSVEFCMYSVGEID